MNKRKLIIKNPIYSEILFLMGYRKVYSNKFANEFDVNRNLGLGEKEKKSKNAKKQSVLFRQLEVLRKAGFLETEKGNFRNNTLYFIKWEKIIEEFLDYSIIYMGKIKTKDKEQEEELKSNIKKLKSKSFRKKCMENFYIKLIFMRSFWEIRQTFNSSNFLIIDVFEYILQNNIMNEISELTYDKIKNTFLDEFDEKSLDKALKEKKSKQGLKYLEELNQFWYDFNKKEYKKIIDNDRDYKFFLEFSEVLFIEDKSLFGGIFREIIPYVVSGNILNSKEKKENKKLLN